MLFLKDTWLKKASNPIKMKEEDNKVTITVN